MAKSYQLVAWTEAGSLRMVPSLVNEAAESYRQRIAYLEALRDDVVDEIGWLLSLSRAHEAFARFLLGMGRSREAYRAFRNAAIVCTCCSDDLWVQGDACSYPPLPLLRRFYVMHRECVRLAAQDRFLALSYEGSELEDAFRSLSQERQELEQELRESFASMRAWRFGKAV